MTDTTTDNETTRSNFIRQIIDEDLRTGKHDQVVTRFPPEPNGYLHIGHAKSICLNFGLARDYQGRCHLRFDDTNPTKEETEYVESIQADVRWLGFDWGEHLYFASDYFERMYELAEHLIERGLAYVDSLGRDEIREYRGTLSEPGRPSPYRGRSVQENLDLFRRMRAGEFEEGAHVLRAKIDMSNPNMLMRDPILYRIQHASHHRTGDAWCIYPMYDYAHCLEDAFEGVTHSICTLEFENNRELYDWVIQETEVECQPQQIEFARLSLEYTLMSKRKLLQLVREHHVSGWDDPRMPTVAGFRRRGVRPDAIRKFADLIGVAKANSTVEMELLDFAIRDDLNMVAPRVMCVLDPLKVTITNFDADEVDWLDCPYYPHDVPLEGSRKVPFTRELYIERDDFALDPPKKWHRLAPGREVRLRYGYYVRCDDVVLDDEGNVVELLCSYDPATRGGSSPDGRKVKGTLHWVSATESLGCEVRVYDRLFSVPYPEADPDKTFLDFLNPESLVQMSGARVEPSVADDESGTRYQFERQGYFWRDPVDGTGGALVFNRIAGLRDSWAKMQQKAEPKPEEATTPTEPKAEKSDDRPSKKPASYERDRAREADPALAGKLDRYQDELGLEYDDADLLTGDAALAAFFEAAVEAYDAAGDIAKFVVNTLLPELDDDADFSALAVAPTHVAILVRMVNDGKITAAVSGEVLREVLETGANPQAIIDERGLEKMDDAAELGAIVDEVIAANPDEVERYRGGKKALLGFFIGKVMQRTAGAADARVVRELLQKTL